MSYFLRCHAAAAATPVLYFVGRELLPVLYFVGCGCYQFCVCVDRVDYSRDPKERPTHIAKGLSSRAIISNVRMMIEPGEPATSTEPTLLDKSKVAATSTEPTLLDKSKVEYSKAKTLVDDVLNQWGWLNDFAAGAVPVRQYVTTYREAAWKAAASVRVTLRSASSAAPNELHRLTSLPSSFPYPGGCGGSSAALGDDDGAVRDCET
jgi:hypothetical protein